MWCVQCVVVVVVLARRGREGLFFAEKRIDKVRERWMSEEKLKRCRDLERGRGNGGRGAASNLGLLMILPEGHRQCRHGWVEYILMPCCVEH